VHKALAKVGTSALAAHMELLLSMVPQGELLNWRAWKVIQLLPPAALAPHLAGLLSIFGKVQSPYWSSVREVVQTVVTSMSPNDVAMVLIMELDQDGARKAAALKRVFYHLPACTLSLHAPLLMILTRDPDTRVRAGAFRTLSKLEPAELAKTLPALLLAGLIDREQTVRCAAICTMCRLPPDVLGPHGARVLRMLWDPHRSVRDEAMQRIEKLLDGFQAPQLREQLRRAAIHAYTTGCRHLSRRQA
jgi:hypothetical protein